MGRCPFCVPERSEDFYKMGNYEDKIYSLNDTVPGQTQTVSQAVQRTLENNGGVGIMTGYYDQNLSILSVSNLLLRSTGLYIRYFHGTDKRLIEKLLL